MLTNEEVIALAKKNGLEILPETMKENDSGLDYYVVTAADVTETKWVLRMPRRQDSMQEATKEKQLLDFVKKQLPIQVPDWKIFTPELIAYPLLKGIPVGTVDEEKQGYIFELDETDVPQAFIETLAKSLVALHNLETTGTDLKMQSVADIRLSMRKRMNQVKNTYGVSDELWTRWQYWLNEDAYWPEKTGLIHGDLHPGHILIDQNSHVTAIIDWTEARVDDISNDFISHYMVFGEESLTELLTTYAKYGGYTWPKMKEHIIALVDTNAISIAEFAQKSDLEAYHEMAKDMLGG